jgi:NAD(P)-dependent dehydrogenase (short-subunit alcohol dehydrogenase family)
LTIDLAGRTAIVTGGSGGLGMALGRALAEAGADVALVSRTLADLEAAAAEIRRDTGRRAIAVAADVTREPEVRAMVDHVLADLGRIDILVNNAGIGGTTPALDLDETEWDRFLQVNLKSAVLCSKHAGREMVRRRSGTIINVSSVAAAMPTRYMSAYAASKAALLSFTRTLALEWIRFGIRVNAVSPGYFRSRMNEDFFRSPAGQRILQRLPGRRIAEPPEIAPAIVFLASDAASYITGSVLVVDGGQSLAALSGAADPTGT